MRQVSVLALAAILITGIAMAQGDTKVSIKTMPPVVVNTIPQSGDADVDPAITEIRVTFSKEMTDKSWSWCTASQESFPEITGEVRYLNDKKTCVAPVKLEPEKTYAVWLNSHKFEGFRDKDNNPAVPYLLIFQTGKSRGTSTLKKIFKR